MNAFAAFHERFDIDDPTPAIDQLADALGLTSPDPDLDPTVALHRLLEDNEPFTLVQSANGAQRHTHQ